MNSILLFSSSQYSTNVITHANQGPPYYIKAQHNPLICCIYVQTTIIYSLYAKLHGMYHSCQPPACTCVVGYVTVHALLESSIWSASLKRQTGSQVVITVQMTI